MLNRLPQITFTTGLRVEDYPSRRGFTLIEMLLTLSLFSMIMATLLLGLRSGSITWKNLKRHQRENADLRSAVETIRNDFANSIWVQEDQTPLTYSSQGEESQSIVVTSAAPLDKLRWGSSYEWATVEYRISKGESPGTNLTRTVTRFIGQKPIAMEPEETTLLVGLREATLDFVTNQGEIVESWEQQDQLPVSVRIDFRLENRRSVLESFRIPIGFLTPTGG